MSVNWSNEIVSLSGPSALLWGLALTIIGAVIIACLWPNRKTATGAIPPLISALIFLGFVIWGNTERTQGMLNSFSTGQAADINGPVPGSEDGTLRQWLLAGAISPATFALIGVMLGLGAYVLVTSRKVQ
ncbi:hypothetical protein [Flaviflexus massiliensis]|uniref:hypothetical protein n=1 Tax=Flaviflexus massiliensis TaxID=1522309 RepID=UPI0006D55603|nr:hypothetical protein [Flaviflexus massiliensis]